MNEPELEIVAPASLVNASGGSLYRDRISAPVTYHLLFLLPLAIVMGSAFLTGAPLVVPVISSIPLLLVWLLCSSLRVSVSRKEVQVRYGFIGPSIPIEAIEECAAIVHDFRGDGVGVQRGTDQSVAYGMPGEPGRAVRIAWMRGKKKRIVVLSSRDPEKLAMAVNYARALAEPRGGASR